MSVTKAAPDETSPAATPAAGAPLQWLASAAKPVALALVVPLLLLVFWHIATTNRWTRLIPTRRPQPNTWSISRLAAFMTTRSPAPC